MQCSHVLVQRLWRGLIRALYEQGEISEAVYRALLEQVR